MSLFLITKNNNHLKIRLASYEKHEITSIPQRNHGISYVSGLNHTKEKN
jgi:hypothetical protein